MREMGGRLGADFSPVRVHRDSASAGRGRAMGARAWTQGRDVYFGRGGFEPSVMAHELVHTVQQGAVRGNVSASMPLGAVQLLPDDEEEQKQQDQEAQKQANPDVKAIRDIERTLLDMFAADDGVAVYDVFEGRLKKLLRKHFKQEDTDFNYAKSVRFLARAAYRDYALRDILLETVSKGLGTKSQNKQLGRDFRAIVAGLDSRIGDAEAEQLAIETGIFTGKPKHALKKKRTTARSYEAETDENGLVGFNPNNVPELAKVQDAIDQARTPQQAYRIFAAFTGNKSGGFYDKYKANKIDMKVFRAKLKHMARVVVDYPELKGMVGDMNVLDPKSKTSMSTSTTRGGIRKSDFDYNAAPDREGPEGEAYRAEQDLLDEKDHFHISPRAYHGTHELGHTMASLLTESDGQRAYNLRKSLPEQLRDKSLGIAPQELQQKQVRMENARTEEENNLAENEMLLDVLTQNDWEIPEKYGMKGFRGVKKSHTDSRGINHMANTIDTYHSDFYKKGMTSKYGSYSAGEFFAEAVADTYAHGKEARPMSIALVKEYEKRQKAKQREKFRYNRKSWWKKIFSFFGF